MYNILKPYCAFPLSFLLVLYVKNLNLQFVGRWKIDRSCGQNSQHVRFSNRQKIEFCFRIRTLKVVGFVCLSFHFSKYAMSAYLNISSGLVSCTWLPHLGQSLLSSKCWTIQVLQTEGEKKKKRKKNLDQDLSNTDWTQHSDTS